MAIFVQDTFTDTDGTSLNTHTPDIGGTWTDTPTPPATSAALIGPPGGGDTDGLSNMLRCNAHFETNRFYNDQAQPSGDYYVEIVITMNGAHGWGNIAGVLGRIQQASGILEGYEAVWVEDSASDEWRLNVWSGGSPTELGSWADAFVSGTRTVRLEMNGSSIKVIIDGTERISVTDSAWSTGRAGLTITGGLRAGLLLDDFIANTFGAADLDAVIGEPQHGLSQLN